MTVIFVFITLLAILNKYNFNYYVIIIIGSIYLLGNSFINLQSLFQNLFVFEIFLHNYQSTFLNIFYTFLLFRITN